MSEVKVELGRHLFYDRRLSGNETASCASCHRPERAFTDGRARAVGSTGELHPRSAMTLTNVAYNAAFNWADPRLDRLEKQILVPLFNERPVELGLEGREGELLRRLAADSGYREMFAVAFPEAGGEIEIVHVVRALAAFVRTLISGGSPYDRLVFWDDEEALSESARRGMRLFFSPRTRCSECHPGLHFSEAEYHNTGLYNLDGKGAYPAGNRGLLEVTGRPEDMGRFRAPTLRNVALTAPYMHDGSVETLEEVIELYAAGGREAPGAGGAAGRDSPLKSPLLEGFDLDADEKKALLDFLDSLTDRGFVTDPRFADPGVRSSRPRPGSASGRRGRDRQSR